MADFFEQPKVEEQPQQEQPAVEEQKAETIKLGDHEYSQDELSQLVGLGQKYQEIETKTNTKLDRVYPEYTKTSQELKEARAEIDRLRQGVTQTGEMDPNAIAQAKQAARQLGIVTDDQFGELLGKSFRQFYMNERAAERLIDDTNSVISSYKEKGLPAASTEDILKHMQENGFRSPEKAYKDMFEKEIDSWKEKQIAQARRPGLYTETGTTAGAKAPAPVKITSDNLSDLISESLNEGKGGF